MSDDHEARVRAIDWSQFHTAYGRADEPGPHTYALRERPGTVADQLVALASSDPQRAMRASNDLWAGLCHQRVFISTAASPALPFLLEALDTADGRLKIEIFDILLGFTVCSAPSRTPDGREVAAWVTNLRARLRDELPRFRAHSTDADEEVAWLAGKIVRLLELDDPS